MHIFVECSLIFSRFQLRDERLKGLKLIVENNLVFTVKIYLEIGACNFVWLCSFLVASDEIKRNKNNNVCIPRLSSQALA